MFILTPKLLFTSYTWLSPSIIPIIYIYIVEVAEHFEMWGAHLPLSLTHTPP